MVLRDAKEIQAEIDKTRIEIDAIQKKLRAMADHRDQVLEEIPSSENPNPKPKHGK